MGNLGGFALRAACGGKTVPIVSPPTTANACLPIALASPLPAPPIDSLAAWLVFSQDAGRFSFSSTSRPTVFLTSGSRDDAQTWVECRPAGHLVLPAASVSPAHTQSCCRRDTDILLLASSSTLCRRAVEPSLNSFGPIASRELTDNHHVRGIDESSRLV